VYNHIHPELLPVIPQIFARAHEAKLMVRRKHKIKAFSPAQKNNPVGVGETYGVRREETLRYQMLRRSDKLGSIFRPAKHLKRSKFFT
jgi:hypothetical protein